MEKIKIIFKKPTLVSVAVLIAGVIIIVFTSWILYTHTVDILTQNLRERLLTISITQSANIDAKDIETLQVEDDWKKPAWTNVVSKLHKAKYSNSDIVFMYIFRKTKDDPTKMELVADADSIDPFANINNDPSGETIPAASCAKCIDSNRDGKIEPDGADKLQWPGQPFPEIADIPESFEAYSGAITVKDIYTDEYGSVLTGFAPIKDENGNTVAILGTDIKADDFFTITTQTLQPFLIFIVFLTSIISILTIILIYASRRYAKVLEKLSADKSEFLSVASHQIKSPLTAIKGYLSLIFEGDYGTYPETLNNVLKIIYQSTESLIRNTKLYLDVSRIEQGVEIQYVFNDFDIGPAIAEVGKEFEPNVTQRGLGFSINMNLEEKYIINADQDRTKEAIGTLLDNAIKYTPSGWIKIQVTNNKVNSTVRVAITDSGVGITKETMPKLFKKFSRATDANKTNTTGSGIGLYAAKTIIEKQHGKVWVESEGAGKGSTFIVEFPAVHVS